jgi:hypothetical protein
VGNRENRNSYSRLAMPSGWGAAHNGKSINHRGHCKRTITVNHTLNVAVELQAIATVNHVNQPQRLMPINRCSYLKSTAIVNRLTVAGHINQPQRLMPINRGGCLKSTAIINRLTVAGHVTQPPLLMAD